MTNFDVKYHIARLTSGSFPFKVGGRWYVSTPPTALAVMMSREVRIEAEQSAMAHDLLTQDEAVALLVKRGLWTKEDEEKLGNLRKWPEDYLVQLYEQRNDAEESKIIRLRLAETRKMLAEFESRRSYFDNITIEHNVEHASIRFLCGCSLSYYDGTPYWRDPEVDRFRPDDVIETAMEKIRQDTLYSGRLRELARSPQWLVLWDTKEYVKHLVDHPVCRLTDEFIHLLRWTALYENARSCDDPPGEDVVSDDDLFDGWRISRERKMKEKMTMAEQYKKFVGREFGKADEVFVVARQDSVDDVINFTNSVMSDRAKQRKANTQEYLKSQEAKEIAKCYEHGSVPIGVFPETTSALSLDREKLLTSIKSKAKENGEKQD